MQIKSTDPIAVIYRDGTELPPVSFAEADEMIRRGHAVQIGGQAIKLFLTSKDKEVLRKFALWRDGYACRICGAQASHVVRMIPRSKRGSDFADNLLAACERCYKSSVDIQEDKIVYEINISKLPIAAWVPNKWHIADKVVSFYRRFYKRNTSRRKVERKIRNLIRNNARMISQSGQYRYFDVGDFILVIEGGDVVVRAMTFLEFDELGKEA